MANYTVVRKSSIDDIFNQRSCPICHPNLKMSMDNLALGSPKSWSANQIEESAGYESLGDPKKTMQIQNHQIESTANYYKAKEKTNVLRRDKILSTQHCLLGSSLYYGGGDEVYDPEKAKAKQNEIKLEEKHEEETIDHFHHDCSRWGNCWEGSLYY